LADIDAGFPVGLNKPASIQSPKDVVQISDGFLKSPTADRGRTDWYALAEPCQVFQRRMVVVRIVKAPHYPERHHPGTMDKTHGT
jgi:hypothetical protein